MHGSWVLWLLSWHGHGNVLNADVYILRSQVWQEVPSSLIDEPLHYF